MRLLWLTDTHLNLLPSFIFNDFVNHLADQKADGIIITGDISNGSYVVQHLKKMSDQLMIPFYFVLGNHDFYGSSFKEIKIALNKLTQEYPNLHYMTSIQSIELSPGTVLVGEDGWYDARFREPITSIAFLPDWFRIKDFLDLSSFKEKMRLVRDQALLAAEAACEKLKQAFGSANRVYFMTHIPPWPERNNVLDKFWMPYNSSKIMAESLISLMEEHPDKELIILSGHTHVRRDEQVLPNLRLKVGEARLFFPKVQEIIDI